MRTPGRQLATLIAAHPLAMLGAGAAAAFVLSLLAGPAGFGLPGAGAARAVVLLEIRLPRAILGLLVGGGLGLAGAALQGFLRNPLAEPGVLGVSSGASLGAVLAIHLGLSQVAAAALPLAGLTGAAATTLLVIALAGERAGPVQLILSGVAVASAAAALTALALNLSRSPFASVEMVFWMMGSLADRSLVHVALAGPLILWGCWLLLRLARTLDALALGEDVARSLGRDLRADRRRLVAGVALAVGAGTAVTGTIGFVGLIVPHILRPLVAESPSRLLAASFLGGATLLLLADVGVRLAQPYVDLRVGVVTAILGAPFFLWLVVRLRAELEP